VMGENAAEESVVIIVTFSGIMVLKHSGVRGRTEVELGLFFLLLCTNSTNHSCWRLGAGVPS